MSDTYKELEYHRDTMKAFESECLVGVVDFSKIMFHCSDTTMWLELRDGTFPRPEMHFRINPHDTKDPDAIHSHKQLCKAIKVPYKFFADNRPKSREAIVRDWVTALIPEGEGSMYKMKVRNCREVSMVRAILPTNVIDYPNYKAVESLISKGEEFGMRMRSITGEMMDACTSELAVSFGDPMDFAGKKYETGLVMRFSDISTDTLRVHAFIFAEDGSDSFPITFGYSPMLDLPYTAMSPQDTDKVLSGLPEALMNLKADVSSRLVAASGMAYSGPEDALEQIAGSLKSPAILKRMRREFLRPDAVDDYPTAVDFAKGVASLANSYDGDVRLSIELVASAYLVLDLPPLSNKDQSK